MTVVRNEFELGENDPGQHPRGAGHQHRVPLAQLRQLDHRRAVGYRERADRAAAGVLSPALPARQRAAGHRRQIRSGTGHQAGGAEVRQHPAAEAHRRQRALAHLHPRSRAGRRALGDAATRGRRAGGDGALQGAAGGRRRLRLRRPARRDPAVGAVRAGSTRRWCEPGIAASVSSSSYAFREPTTIVARAEVRKDGSLADARAASCSRRSTRSRSTPPTAEEVERARGTILKNIDLLLNQSDQVGLTLSDWASRAATGGCCSSIATGSRRPRPRMCARVARTYLKPDNRTVGRFIPTEKPDRAPLPPRARRGGAGEGLHVARRPSLPARHSIPRRRTSSRASCAARCPPALKTAYLPKKTRGQSVNATLTLHYGTLEGVTGKAAAADLTVDMLMRGTRKPLPPADQGRLDSLKAKLSHQRRADPAQRVDRDHAAQPAGGAAAAGRRCCVSRRSMPKEFEELGRRTSPRSSSSGRTRSPLARRPTTAPSVRGPKGHPRATRRPSMSRSRTTPPPRSADAQSFYAAVPGASSGELAVVGDFDAGRGQCAAHGVARQLEEPDALRARAAAGVRREGNRHHDRDARQGQRLLHLRARRSSSGTTTPTTPRWSWPTTSSVAGSSIPAWRRRSGRRKG